jgi:hypothetical protein
MTTNVGSPLIAAETAQVGAQLSVGGKATIADPSSTLGNHRILTTLDLNTSSPGAINRLIWMGQFS